jgi:hypothetical protein
VTYSNADKVFSSADVTRNASILKKDVVNAKRGDILGVKPQSWNQSSKCVPDLQSDRKDLKHQLLKVRAGLMDQPPSATSVAPYTDEQMADSIRYITNITGKGPIGALTKEWCNAVDERGLPAHCIESQWKDWNRSTAVCAPEDVSVKQRRFEEIESRRIRMNVPSKKVNQETYHDPQARTSKVGQEMASIKVTHQALKNDFKAQLKEEFPNASEERLQALAHRLLEEKLRSDAKISRQPVPQESFKPNLTVTTMDRRYKEFFHPGKWSTFGNEECWSCCMGYSFDSKGCEYKVIDPDAWCLLHC